MEHFSPFAHLINGMALNKTGKISTIGFLVLLLWIVPVAMATLDTNSIIIDDIEYYIQTDKSVYDLGENVEMLYRVTNLRDEEWRVEWFFPTFDVIAEEKNGGNFNEIWNWSWDKFHSMGPTVVTLGPNESTGISGIWSQIDLNGSVEIEDHTQVPPGVYRISGVFYPTDSSISVDVTVVPEPATLLLLGLGGLALLKRGRK